MTKDPYIKSLEDQIDKLANYILKKYPEWPGNTGEPEGAVDCAIRILESHRNKTE